jgi:Tfp pilus assembly protein PilV
MRKMWTHRWKSIGGNQTGDTIVEVLISIAVISLVLGGAFVVAQRSSNTLESSQEHNAAEELARNQIEQIRTIASNEDKLATLKNNTAGSSNGQYCLSGLDFKNIADMDTPCKQQFYTISISRPDAATEPNLYTATVQWDELNGGHKGEVDMSYRMNPGAWGSLTQLPNDGSGTVTIPPPPSPNCPNMTLTNGSDGHSITIALSPVGTPPANIAWSYIVTRPGKMFSGAMAWADTGLAYGTTYTYTVTARATNTIAGRTTSRVCPSKSLRTLAPTWTTIHLCWLPRQWGSYEMFQTLNCAAEGAIDVGGPFNIIAWNSPVKPSSLQIWRIYNPTTGDHALTTSTSGVWSGYVYEATYGYSNDASGHRVDSWYSPNGYYWGSKVRNDHAACPTAWGAGACGIDQGGPLFYAQ